MPLHLLAKKSWNVYNADNIERVRRDEEIARRKEEEDEMKMQQEDAERRMMELRTRALERLGRTEETKVGGGGGEALQLGVDRDPVRAGSAMDQSMRQLMDGNKLKERNPSCTALMVHENGSTTVVLDSKRREGHGEDSPIDPQVHKSLTDKSGHMNFFSDHPSGPKKLSARERNPVYEKEKAEKEVKIAEQFNMALGKPAEELRPWYVTVNRVGGKQEKKTEKQLEIEKSRDSRFKDRNDPMTLMRKGVRQLKEVEEVRKKIEEERKYELERLKMEQERLEEFSLDERPQTNHHSFRGSSRNGRLGKYGRRRSRSRDHGPGNHNRRRRGRSRSPESNSDRAKRRSQRDKDGTGRRDRDHRRDRSWDHNRNRESSHRHHSSSNMDEKKRIQDCDRPDRSNSGRTSDQGLRGEDYHKVEHGHGLKQSRDTW